MTFSQDSVPGTFAASAGWSRRVASRVEDLSDAVLGAGLEVTQMSRGALSASLAFAERDGIVHSSGRIDGRVALVGPLSQDRPTLGVGLRLAPGSRHWLNEVST